MEITISLQMRQSGPGPSCQSLGVEVRSVDTIDLPVQVLLRLQFLPADYKTTIGSCLRARPICYLKLAEEALPRMTAKEKRKFKINQKRMTKRHFYFFQWRKK